MADGIVREAAQRVLDNIEAVDANPESPSRYPSRRDFDRAVADLRSALAASAPPAAPGGEGWQPIETAPRDGTWVLVASYRGTDLNWISNARWREPSQGCRPRQFCWSDGQEYLVGPSHWMPLPAPPALAAPPERDEEVGP